MKIMPCPLNGPRNIQEFICAGPVEAHPDPNRCSDEEWAEYVWLEENVAGVVREWWCHVATSYWFIAERNTVTDEILATYPADRVFSERVTFEPLAPPPESAPAPAEAKPEPPTEATPPPEAPPPPAAPAQDAPAEERGAPAEAPVEAAPGPPQETVPPEAPPEPEPQLAAAGASPERPEADAPADDAAEGDTTAAQASPDDAPAERPATGDTPQDEPSTAEAPASASKDSAT